jgi:hypothetical protein
MGWNACSDAAVPDLYARRPILEFVVKRLIDAINQPVPAG